MKLRILQICIFLLAAAVAVSSHSLPGGGSYKLLARGAKPYQNDEELRKIEKQIEKRDKDQKGISVGEPKIYDDSLLQQMLNAAQAKLAALQVLDQGSIVQRLGSVTGATQDISSLGINVQGPSIPGSKITTKSPTGSTGETTQTTVAPDGKVTTVTTETGTSGVPTRDVETTIPQATPPPVTAPTPATTLPTSFSVSSSDILNEQMQLTYEIANFRLLLEGSHSDRLVRSKTKRMVKPRVTIGIPITLSPDKRHKDAVAIVEIEVEKINDIGDGEPPAITALLPREKTYNVASITERNTQIGGGVVTQLVGVSGSWLRGHRTYYLVKDQDTLALTFQPNDENRAGFLWQFRPVLGQEYVRSGLKLAFVQLAFPTEWSAPEFGKLHIRTYWRKYDRKKGIIKDVIAGSLHEAKKDWKIPNYDLKVEPKEFNVGNLEDLGNGQMLVRLYGRFLGGTYVRIGQTLVGEGSPGWNFAHYGIRFVAPITDLATKKVVLVGRDGQETPLEIEQVVLSSGTSKPKDAPKISAVSVSTVDEANSLLTIRLNDKSYIDGQPPMLIVIGGRALGYSDWPIERKEDTLSVVVPTAWLIADPRVTVKPLFAPKAFYATRPIRDFDAASHTERLVLFEQGKDRAKFLLFGNRLDNTQILSPQGLALQEIGRKEDSKTLRLVELTADQIKSQRYLILQRKAERPIFLSIPLLEFKESKPPDPKPKERVTVNADKVIVEGVGLNELEKVVFNGKSIPFKPSADGKSVLLTGLRARGVTSSATTQQLEFSFKSAKTTVKLEIVNNKVETIPR
jgi:hypothetical protein